MTTNRSLTHAKPLRVVHEQGVALIQSYNKHLTKDELQFLDEHCHTYTDTLKRTLNQIRYFAFIVKDCIYDLLSI